MLGAAGLVEIIRNNCFLCCTSSSVKRTNVCVSEVIASNSPTLLQFSQCMLLLEEFPLSSGAGFWEVLEAAGMQMGCRKAYSIANSFSSKPLFVIEMVNFMPSP